VISGDARIEDHQSALFVDPRALAADEELIEYRHGVLAAIRVHD
jgi:hypothetical protein